MTNERAKIIRKMAERFTKNKETQVDNFEMMKMSNDEFQYFLNLCDRINKGE